MRTERETVITAKPAGLGLGLKELWQYRELVAALIRRNFATLYKQTVLGPVWLLAAPLLSAGVFTLVFGRLVGLPTGNSPQYLFYLSGTVLWGFFAACLERTAATFVRSAHLCSSAWFPRLAVPLSEVLTQLCHCLLRLAVLVGLLLVLGEVRLTASALMVPLLLVHTGFLALGIGLLLAALTAKYRDLLVVVGFALQLWLYASPVVYPAALVPDALRELYLLNPMAPVLEAFRFALLGDGSLPATALTVSLAVSLGLMALGLVVFRRVERTFLDTV